MIEIGRDEMIDYILTAGQMNQRLARLQWTFEEQALWASLGYEERFEAIEPAFPYESLGY